MTRDELRVFLSPLPDEAIFGLTLYGEARGEPIEGLIAVACVIRNRLLDSKKRWGADYRAVCLQPHQFSTWSEAGGKANYEELIRATTILLSNEIAPPLLEQAAWCALGVSRGAIIDNVKKSNHYHVSTMNPRPKWAQPYAPKLQVGHHVFYVL